jgi:acyl-CoA reductase-like NAD-dependent aldehyde dehydrogenase
MTPRQHLLIDGRLVSSPECLPVVDPARGQPFAICPRASGAQLDEALAAAARAFSTWRLDLDARRQALARCAEALKARADEIASLLVAEQGKPQRAALGEVQGAVAWLRAFARLPVEDEVLVDDERRRIRVVRRALGPVAAITPWNYPVALLAWKLAPALLAGNTVVVKPSPFTPLATLLVGEILAPCLPPGVLNVLAGGDELGAALVAHPAVRKVSFTGSAQTGRRVMAAAAGDLKRLTLELGGNDPAIVFDDVDPARVADALFWSAFENSGQVCVAIKRLYVQDKVYSALVERLAARARSVKVGPGGAPDTQLGPLNNRPQLEKVVALVDEARARGARVEVGGVRPDGPGYFYPPTIVSDAHAGLRLVDEEQFGPALPVIRYHDIDDAIAQANASHYGLGGSVWTADVARGEQLVQQLECGTGWVNQHMDLTPLAPFGGWKHSGFGHEGGRWGLAEFSALQTVNTRK